MSTGENLFGGMTTARGRDYPSIRQFSIFSPNKVGQLQHLSKVIEEAELKVCALSISDSAECAIIRLVVSHPERAFEILQSNGYAFCEVDLLVVELPKKRSPIWLICSTLLQAEINIHYSFPLMIRPHGRPALAFYVDDHEMGARILARAGFTVLTEDDLER